MPVSAEELYRWHARPGAFRRLTPPWDDVRTVEHSGGVEDGARRVMKLRQGPVTLTWEALHRDHIEGRQFVDEQVRGPFARWVHTHRFEPIDAITSLLVDDVDYELPLGAMGRLFGARHAESVLDSMFAFRHRRTAEDLQRHADSGPSPRKVAISGSSGLIGDALAAFLTTGGHQVRRLVRGGEDVGPDSIFWDPQRQVIDADALEGLDAVIHLAGEPVQGRWTQQKRRRIEESRVEGTALIARTLAALKRPPKAFVTASGVGFYGDRGDRRLTEGSDGGEGFLARVAQDWEQAAGPAHKAGIRTVFLRLGVVLSPRGGALPEFLRGVKLGLTSRLGSGDQFVSWIDLDDVLGAILFLLSRDDLAGPFNLTAPTPISNHDFFATLADVVSRPALIPVPAAALRLALGGQAADEIALTGQRALPARLVESGFQFFRPDLEQALAISLGLVDTSGPVESPAPRPLEDPHGAL